jgi:anti-sigma factor RsiW
MRDCPNAAMRERLPDLTHDRLPASSRAEVLAHLETCADCRAELALIERVRVASSAPRVDTDRIVSALPAYRPASGGRRRLELTLLRVAAIIVLVAGGAWLLLDSPGAPDPALTPPIVSAPAVQVPTGSTTQVAVRSNPSAPRAAEELAVGEMFDDLTDGELQALLEAFGTVEALTPVETEVVVPAIGRGVDGA